MFRIGFEFIFQKETCFLFFMLKIFGKRIFFLQKNTFKKKTKAKENDFHHYAWVTQLRRIVATVPKGWFHRVRFDQPGN